MPSDCADGDEGRKRADFGEKDGWLDGPASDTVGDTGGGVGLDFGGACSSGISIMCEVEGTGEADFTSCEVLTTGAHLIGCGACWAACGVGRVRGGDTLTGTRCDGVELMNVVIIGWAIAGDGRCTWDGMGLISFAGCWLRVSG